GGGAIDRCGAGHRGTVAGGRTPPVVTISGTAQVQVRQDLVLLGDTQIGNSSSAGVLLGGSFDNQGASESLFDWTKGTLTVYGEGVHRVEISGRDIGPTIQGFGSGEYTNFAMGTIEVQAGVTVEFVDNVDNDGDPTMCDEALYVHELILGTGAHITIENCRVYAEVFQGEMAVVAGMGMGCGAFGFLPTGDFDRNRRVDLQDWALVRDCLQGPSVQALVDECGLTDFDGDTDVDLNDLRWFQTRFTGP
ncbi:MAG: hypothetical protein Q7R41_06065, partial [Phycisphaerales bacterium]|nr:hypothetical protein [Phycisphaerales bacterium]